MQPIMLYSHKKGPNPWKVALILEELGLPYKAVYLEFDEVKVEPYILLNPNGKLPAIQDPNNDVTLFESGAIIEYLVEQYDRDSILSPSSLQDKYLARSWLYVQVSGQGPPCGFKVWMDWSYPTEQIVAANEFLTKEIKRLIGVIDSHLRRSRGPYLLGDKVTYADLFFVPFNLVFGLFVPNHEPATEYPVFALWLSKLMERPAVKKIMEVKASLT